MRFLLDTNILIPLEDSKLPLRPSLANFVRLAHAYGHSLVYHPASEDDIREDTNEERRAQTLDRLGQYTRLDSRTACPWNTENTGLNDARDNEILYALSLNAAHGLITEDRGIHDKAKARELVDRVYTIQTAEDLLRRLHEKVAVRLPNVEDVPLYSLTPFLPTPFFDTLREGYPQFDDWFREKAKSGRRAWVNWERPGELGGICIYAQQDNERITEEITLAGSALKLATFKVGDTNRGRKVGELFLVEDVIRVSKTRLWSLSQEGGGGVSRRELFAYINGSPQGVALALKRQLQFGDGIDPNALFGRDFRPPQSFRYLKEHELEQLSAHVGGRRWV